MINLLSIAKTDYYHKLTSFLCISDIYYLNINQYIHKVLTSMLLHSNVYKIYMTVFAKLCRDAYLICKSGRKKSQNSSAGNIYYDSDGSSNHSWLLIHLICTSYITFTVTRHHKDNISKAISSIFLFKMISKHIKCYFN